MRLVYLLLTLTVITVACQKDNKDDTVTSVNGSYAGIFHRTGMDSVSVELTLNDGNFSGLSEKDHYPAICGGTYQLEDDNRIIFADSCAWTADFDWTLILDGTYTFNKESKKLKITRTNASVTDEYFLELIVR